MEPIYRQEGMGNDRPLGSLFRQLSQDLGTLLRQEAELARAEISAKIAKLGSAVGVLGAGALIALAGFLCLVLAAVLGLAVVLGSLLVASVIVGVVALLSGIALLAYGRSQLTTEELKPTRTIESLRKDAELASGSLSGETH